MRLVHMGLATLACAALLIGSAATYEAACRHCTAMVFPSPGKMVDIGGRRIEVDCRGAGSPTVVFESGFGPGGPTSWSKVQDDVAKSTRACAYSRAGIMWSDPANTPRTGEAVAADLHAALHNAGEAAPFVLVAHSAGGPYAVLFTRYFPSEVAGLVLVDSSHPDQSRQFEAVGFKTLSASRLQRLSAMLSWTGVERLGVGRMFDLPLPALSASRDIRAVYAYLPTSSAAAVKELAGQDQVWTEVAGNHDLGSRPLYVLTATKFPSEQERHALNATVEMAEQHQKIWDGLQDDEATWSTFSRHDLVPDAGHCIQCDRPDVVSSAALWVVENIRASH